MKFNIFIFVAFLFATCSFAQTPKDIKHVVVYQEEGKFAGWPANNGAWIFEGDELLVGFTRGEYKLKERDHNIGKGLQECWLARSTRRGRKLGGLQP